MNPDHDSPSTGTIGTSPGGFVPKTLFPPPLWVVDIINTLHAGYFFHAFVVVCLLFPKIISAKLSVSNGLAQDQAPRL